MKKKKKTKVLSVKKQKEIDKSTKFEHRFEDDFCIQIFKWDKSKFKNGAISSETIYKKLLPPWERMMSKAAVKRFNKENNINIKEEDE